MSEFPFKYHLRISPRSRSIRFRVTPAHGLEVVIPQGYDPGQVPALLKRRQRWIRAALERVESLRAFYGPAAAWCLPGRIELPAVGLAWAVTAKQGDNAVRTAVREAGAGQLLISGAIDDEPACRTALGRWLLRQAHQHLVPGLERTSRELGLPYKRALIRRQKTRWGSCSRSGTISLNAKLLFLSPETVNYVMIHELCHRVELNHSPRFWRLVERHCPDYRRIDAQRRELWKAVPRWADAP
ncbi:MAG: M48 family metallopeptidase [Gammaproteobacteria bacterium]|nr:M48 family metallopeptidase [Gammaproteobacteria bacterium]